ncbi:cytochrome P450 [Haloferax mediterranei]|nr:cytochrome P450 [Haloferax mediterranei]EMA04485.1 cytochrome P450 [Haloferax mediterranei ATCC 33500]
MPLVGHSVDFAFNPFDTVADLLANYGVGDAVGLDVVGLGDLYVVAHPDHFERALVTERDAVTKGHEFEAAFGDAVVASEGDNWRRQRAELDPFFTRGRVNEHAPVMRQQIERRLETWPQSGTLSLETEMKSMALEVIFATVLGRKLDIGADERVRAASDGLNGRFAPASWVLPAWVPTPSRRRFRRAEKMLREEVQQLIETADEDSLTKRLTDALGSDYPETAESLENQLIGMIFAGHETTALALTYTVYVLAAHPDVRKQAVEEVDRVVSDSPVTVDELGRLPVLERVIKEALRLYPPVHTIPRETTKPLPVGERTIPAGSDLHLSVIRVHRDERWYDEPFSFDPDRWTKAIDRPVYAYLPFGAGPRSCLGRAFALTEMKIVLATMLREFEIDWGKDKPIEIMPEMTTQPKGQTPLVVRRR